MSVELLHEDVFTLSVSPPRVVEPATVVRASFICANVGGGVADDVRVRFTLPDGLAYRAGSGSVDGSPISDEAELFAGGASIGSLPPDSERLMTIEYDVAGAIENGSTLPIQAALLVSGETFGSNVVELVARSRPSLQNEHTYAALDTPDDNAFDAFRVGVQIHNDGQSSANDVVVVLPVPEHTSFVAKSAQLDGRPIEPGQGMTFEIPSIAPGDAATLEYRVEVDGPLPGTAVTLRRVRISANEIPEFLLPGVDADVTLAPSFDGDDFTLDVASEPVIPGVPTRITATIHNDAPVRADDVLIRLVLGDGLVVAPASRRIAGRPIADESTGDSSEANRAANFWFHRISPDEMVEVACDGYVTSPATDGAKLSVCAEIKSASRSRTIERTITVRCAPLFDPARNLCEIAGPSIVTAGESTELLVQVVNDGTSDAKNVAIQMAQTPLDVRALDSDVTTDDPHVIGLGTLEPNAVRQVRVQATVPPHIANGTRLPFAVTLVADGVEPLELPAVTIVADARPHFSAGEAWLTHLERKPLRPGKTTRARVTITNSGSDVAPDLRLVLSLPREAKLMGVDGTRSEESTLFFGDVAAGAMVRAEIRLRLLAPLAEERTLTIGGVLQGANVRPLVLEEKTIDVLAEPTFSSAMLRTEPADVAQAGEPITLVLTTKNVGDGPARRVTVGVDGPAGLAYARGSTTVNDIAVVDGASGSALYTARGLILEDVAAGASIEVRWRAVSDPMLVGGTTVSARAHVNWDDGGSLVVVSNPVRIAARPAFATRTTGLSFRIGTAAVRISGAGHADAPHAEGAHAEVAHSEPMLAEAATAGAAAEAQPVEHEAASEPIVDEPVAPLAESVDEADMPEDEDDGTLYDSSGVAVADEPPSAAAVEPIDEAPPEPAVAEHAVEETPVAEAVTAEPEEAHADTGHLRLGLVLDATRIEKLERFLLQAKFKGLVTHVFSMRAFFPERVLAADGAVSERTTALESLLVEERDALRSVLDRLFIKVRIPNYDISPSDIEDRSARNALVALLEAMTALPSAPQPGSPGDVYAEAKVAYDELEPTLKAVREAPLGDPAPFRALVEFMPRTAHGWPALADAFGRYYEELHAVFAPLGEMEPDAFHRALFSYETPELDRIREEIMTTLAARTAVSS